MLRFVTLSLGLTPVACVVLACGGDPERAPPADLNDAATVWIGPGDAGPREGGSQSGTCAAAKAPFGIDKEFGQSFPDHPYLTCDGEVVSARDMRCEHQLTLVSIGAGWCEPCEAEALVLEDLYQRYRRRGLGVVQLMYADRQGFVPGLSFCAAWQREFALSYPVYIDVQKSSLQYLNIGVTPLNFVMNQRGQVIWAGFGVLPADIEAYLDAWL
ncbi:MAG: redoxin family protein [Polyangiaceae bacterium]|nr:redoxin family protein [Polyangiaceae bacterium]